MNANELALQLIQGALAKSRKSGAAAVAQRARNGARPLREDVAGPPDESASESDPELEVLIAQLEGDDEDEMNKGYG